MKTALFLGAGASVFADLPTTIEIMDRVRDRAQNRKSEPYRNQNFQNDIMKIVNDPVYGDVEKLYDGIKQIIDINSNLNCKPIIGPAVINSLRYGEMIGELTDLRSSIHTVLRKSFEIKADVHRPIRQMYDMIWKAMKNSKTSEFQVFTTNYDTVMEEYCKEANLDIVNGFKPHRYMSRVWSGEWTTGANNFLHLTKLHGSINWYRDADGEIVEIGGAGQRDADNDVIIAPTEGAKDYSREPFSTLMDHFKTEIEKVDVLLVIGFSYRDADITNIIKDRVDDGMALISLSPDAARDIRHVSDADVKTVEAGGQQFKVIDPRIILCEQKFGPDTARDVRSSLEAAYGLVWGDVTRARGRNAKDAKP